MSLGILRIKEIIHIQLEEEYPDSAYEDIRNILSKYFKRVSDDTFQLKKGINMRFNKRELIIYEVKKE